jgi:hypothetical protein
VTVTVDADPGVPVAVIVTGLTFAVDGAVAVKVFCPAVVPSVHEPAVATPLGSVTADVALSVPPPLATLNVIVIPATGPPLAVATRTAGAFVTLVPTVAVSPVVLATATMVVGPEGSVDPPQAVTTSATTTAHTAREYARGCEMKSATMRDPFACERET